MSLTLDVMPVKPKNVLYQNPRQTVTCKYGCVNNSNSNQTPGNSRETSTSGSRQSGSGHPSSSIQEAPPSPGRNLFTSLLIYFLLLVRDLLTFLTRGGLSAIMFLLDQTLRAALLVFEVAFGGVGLSVVSYPCRISMWLYQMAVWVVYTSVELVLYLPWQLLIVYALFLSLVLYFLPAPLLSIAGYLLKPLHWFVTIYRSVYPWIGVNKITERQSEGEA